MNPALSLKIGSNRRVGGAVSPLLKEIVTVALTSLVSRWCASILAIDVKGDGEEIDIQTGDTQDRALQYDRFRGLIDGEIGNIDRANVIVDRPIRTLIFIRGDDAKKTRRGARIIDVDRTIDVVIPRGWHDEDRRIIVQIEQIDA